MDELNVTIADRGDEGNRRGGGRGGKRRAEEEAGGRGRGRDGELPQLLPEESEDEAEIHWEVAGGIGRNMNPFPEAMGVDEGIEVPDQVREMIARYNKVMGSVDVYDQLRKKNGTTCSF